MLRKFWQNRRANLVEAMIGIILMGAISYGFWTAFNTTMSSAGDTLKTKVESDDWLN